MLNPTVLVRTLAARYPEVVPLLSSRARLLAGVKADIAGINSGYHDAITEALIAYFEGGGIAASRNDMKQAMIEAFGEAFDAGWVEAGGELPIDDDALAWVENRLNEEVAHIDALFQQAKELRKDAEFDYFSWATARADGYTNNLFSVYNAASMLANAKQMLTWQLGDTEVHCATCAKLDGQRHKASWYISRDYIPRKAGAAMDCGGYNCDCSLVNDEGDEVTI